MSESTIKSSCFGFMYFTGTIRYIPASRRAGYQYSHFILLLAYKKKSKSDKMIV